MRRLYLLTHLVSESASATPEATAIRGEPELVTYGALEEQSNRIARALHAEGLAPGDRIGLHMPKTPTAIVALFGILKAGGCVVPVGVGTPTPRFRDLAEQCGMRGIVGTADACRRLGSQAFEAPQLEVALLTDGQADALDGLPVRAVDLPEAERAQSSDPLSVPTIDRDLAYVLFTSGSTGSPKGVMLSHRAVLTFVTWAAHEFGIGPEDRLSNHAPLNFDLSTFDIYAALGSGASVTVILEGLTMFPVRLAELIELREISVWYSVPSVLTLLATKGGLAGCDTGALRTVLFAGEVFPIRHLREVMQAVPAARFFNLYGPTETNVCTYHEVEGIPAADAAPIPIGRPCANTRTVVLDAEGAPVTRPGAEGLLHVAGSSLMDGYYGRPEETAAAFGRNPLTPGRDERIYCTGDWVAIGPAGEYLFLGRRDHMIKVGGYRIELGEIETALYAHPGVREAAAVAVPDDLLGNRIRAAVVAERSGVDEQELKRHCGALLPRYMIPHEIRFLDALPRTSTDKVDRPLLAREEGSG